MNLRDSRQRMARRRSTDSKPGCVQVRPLNHSGTAAPVSPDEFSGRVVHAEALGGRRATNDENDKEAKMQRRGSRACVEERVRPARPVFVDGDGLSEILHRLLVVDVDTLTV